MCTLIALHRCVAGAPLVIAANRDEYYERPAEAIALRGTPRGAIVAPRDKRAGGTWLGLNAGGLFAAVTNRRNEAPDSTRRSRGLLVLEALSEDTAEGAARRFDRLAENAYNPFNLLVADRDSAHLLTYDGGVERFDLAPGPHVIGNVHPQDASPKVTRLRAQVAGADHSDPDRVLEDLAAVCRGHEGDDALQATCVHAGGYGTRSSMILRLGEPGGRHVLSHTDGAPCAVDYQDATPLLCDLGLDSRA